MKIIKALPSDLRLVSEITHTTIKAVYPRYYPEGAVNFFLDHHCDDNISSDIADGFVYLLSFEGTAVGTVTVKKNELLRLFVLPKYQGRGFGKALIDFAERIILEKYNKVELSASFPAKALYLKRGYIATDFNALLTDNGDYLCYDTMVKWCID